MVRREDVETLSVFPSEHALEDLNTNISAETPLLYPPSGRVGRGSGRGGSREKDLATTPKVKTLRCLRG